MTRRSRNEEKPDLVDTEPPPAEEEVPSEPQVLPDTRQQFTVDQWMEGRGGLYAAFAHVEKLTHRQRKMLPEEWAALFEEFKTAPRG